MTKKQSNNQVEPQKPRRIAKFYDVDECVAKKSIGQKLAEGRTQLVRNLKNPQFYKSQRKSKL